MVIDVTEIYNTNRNDTEKLKTKCKYMETEAANKQQEIDKLTTTIAGLQKELRNKAEDLE